MLITEEDLPSLALTKDISLVQIISLVYAPSSYTSTIQCDAIRWEQFEN